MKKKLLALFMCVIMCVSLFTITSFAADGENLPELLTVIIDAGNDDGHAYFGGMATDTYINVYKGGWISLGYDENGDTIIESKYNGKTYFKVYYWNSDTKEVTGIHGLPSNESKGIQDNMSVSFEYGEPGSNLPDLLTVTIDAGTEEGHATFEGGKTTATIQVYEGGQLSLRTDEDGNDAIISTYDYETYFTLPYYNSTTHLAFDLNGLPTGDITEDMTLSFTYVKYYTLTIKTNAENRGELISENSFVPTSKPVNMNIYDGATLKLADFTDENQEVLKNGMVVYDYNNMIGDNFFPDSQVGYKFDHWEGIPADGEIHSDLTLTAWFVPIANTSISNVTSSHVSANVTQAIADSTNMNKANVSGLDTALDDRIMEFLMSDEVGLGLEEADGANVTIDASVDVTLTDGAKADGSGTMSFSVKPTATVTKDGETLATDVSVSNEYLGGQEMTVIIPCGGIIPDKIEHRSADGTLIETFTADGDPAFTYDAENDTVIVKITEFSSLTITGIVSDVPATADNSSTVLWVILLAVAAASAAAAYGMKKRAMR